MNLHLKIAPVISPHGASAPGLAKMAFLEWTSSGEEAEKFPARRNETYHVRTTSSASRRAISPDLPALDRREDGEPEGTSKVEKTGVFVFLKGMNDDLQLVHFPDLRSFTGGYKVPIAYDNVAYMVNVASDGVVYIRFAYVSVVIRAQGHKAMTIVHVFQ